MKYLSTIVAFLALWSAAPLQAGDIPHGVAGFVIGQNVAEFNDRLQMASRLPLRYQEYLQEVEIKPLTGFKSGLITYGTCAQPGRIVRIKMKYADAGRSFYDALLARVERRFGKPTAYDGDAFHIVIEWKWSFIDADGNQITLHLSHNSRDVEEKFGNAVKLTLVTGVDEERQCFLAGTPPQRESQTAPHPPLKSMTAEDWKQFVPYEGDTPIFMTPWFPCGAPGLRRPIRP